MKQFTKQHEDKPTYSTTELYMMMYTFVETRDMEGLKILHEIIIDEAKQYSLITL